MEEQNKKNIYETSSSDELSPSIDSIGYLNIQKINEYARMSPKPTPLNESVSIISAKNNNSPIALPFPIEQSSEELKKNTETLKLSQKLKTKKSGSNLPEKGMIHLDQTLSLIVQEKEIQNGKPKPRKRNFNFSKALAIHNLENLTRKFEQDMANKKCSKTQPIKEFSPASDYKEIHTDSSDDEVDFTESRPNRKRYSVLCKRESSISKKIPYSPRANFYSKNKNLAHGRDTIMTSNDLYQKVGSLQTYYKVMKQLEQARKKNLEYRGKKNPDRYSIRSKGSVIKLTSSLVNFGFLRQNKRFKAKIYKETKKFRERLVATPWSKSIFPEVSYKLEANFVKKKYYKNKLRNQYLMEKAKDKKEDKRLKGFYKKIDQFAVKRKTTFFFTIFLINLVLILFIQGNFRKLIGIDGCQDMIEDIKMRHKLNFKSKNYQLEETKYRMETLENYKNYKIPQIFLGFYLDPKIFNSTKNYFSISKAQNSPSNINKIMKSDFLKEEKIQNSQKGNIIIDDNSIEENNQDFPFISNFADLLPQNIFFNNLITSIYIRFQINQDNLSNLNNKDDALNFFQGRMANYNPKIDFYELYINPKDFGPPEMIKKLNIFLENLMNQQIFMKLSMRFSYINLISSTILTTDISLDYQKKSGIKFDTRYTCLDSGISESTTFNLLVIFMLVSSLLIGCGAFIFRIWKLLKRLVTYIKEQRQKRPSDNHGSYFDIESFEEVKDSEIKASFTFFNNIFKKKTSKGQKSDIKAQHSNLNDSSKISSVLKNASSIPLQQLKETRKEENVIEQEKQNKNKKSLFMSKSKNSPNRMKKMKKDEFVSFGIKPELDFSSRSINKTPVIKKSSNSIDEIFEEDKKEIALKKENNFRILNSNNDKFMSFGDQIINNPPKIQKKKSLLCFDEAKSKKDNQIEKIPVQRFENIRSNLKKPSIIRKGKYKKPTIAQTMQLARKETFAFSEEQKKIYLQKLKNYSLKKILKEPFTTVLFLWIFWLVVVLFINIYSSLRKKIFNNFLLMDAEKFYSPEFEKRKHKEINSISTLDSYRRLMMINLLIISIIWLVFSGKRAFLTLKKKIENFTNYILYLTKVRQVFFILFVYLVLQYLVIIKICGDQYEKMAGSKGLIYAISAGLGNIQFLRIIYQINKLVGIINSIIYVMFFSVFYKNFFGSELKAKYYEIKSKKKLEQHVDKDVNHFDKSVNKIKILENLNLKKNWINIICHFLVCKKKRTIMDKPTMKQLQREWNTLLTMDKLKKSLEDESKKKMLKIWYVEKGAKEKIMNEIENKKFNNYREIYEKSFPVKISKRWRIQLVFFYSLFLIIYSLLLYTFMQNESYNKMILPARGIKKFMENENFKLSNTGLLSYFLIKAFPKIVKSNKTDFKANINNHRDYLVFGESELESEMVMLKVEFEKGKQKVQMNIFNKNKNIKHSNERKRILIYKKNSVRTNQKGNYDKSNISLKYKKKIKLTEEKIKKFKTEITKNKFLRNPFKNLLYLKKLKISTQKNKRVLEDNSISFYTKNGKLLYKTQDHVTQSNNYSNHILIKSFLLKNQASLRFEISKLLIKQYLGTRLKKLEITLSCTSPNKNIQKLSIISFYRSKSDWFGIKFRNHLFRLKNLPELLSYSLITLFCVLIEFFFLVRFYKPIMVKWKYYDIWYNREIIGNLTNQELLIRSLLKYEIIRKLQYVGFYKIAFMIFYSIILFGYFPLIAYYIYLGIQIKPKQKTANSEYLEFVEKLFKLKQVQNYVATLLIFFIITNLTKLLYIIGKIFNSFVLTVVQKIFRQFFKLGLPFCLVVMCISVITNPLINYKAPKDNLIIDFGWILQNLFSLINFQKIEGSDTGSSLIKIFTLILLIPIRYSFFSIIVFKLYESTKEARTLYNNEMDSEKKSIKMIRKIGKKKKSFWGGYVWNKNVVKIPTLDYLKPDDLKWKGKTEAYLGQIISRANLKNLYSHHSTLGILINKISEVHDNFEELLNYTILESNSRKKYEVLTKRKKIINLVFKENLTIKSIKEKLSLSESKTKELVKKIKKKTLALFLIKKKLI